ncbi:MAG: hypothetical protein CO093_05170 [Alphaproteobacteria bacterium CG_4_9_14_3_um_filter_47_13]|nr:MAG: hypothetical protein CO093_05170 [Alphaproteobacteria bacterium CG_4_9_14_3_um_filter_47_13]
MKNTFTTASKEHSTNFENIPANDSNLISYDDYSHAGGVGSSGPRLGQGSDALIRNPNAWGADGTPQTITYIFLDNKPPGYDSEFLTGFQSFRDPARAAAMEILHDIELQTNINFVEVTKYSESNISFGVVDRPGGIAGTAWFPSNTDQKGTIQGDLWVDVRYNGTYEDGSFALYNLRHELLHTLGLRHSFEGGLIGPENTTIYTNLAYQRPVEHPHSNMLYDIEALQKIYGVDTTSTSGNDTYILETGTHAIWDSGGIDTIDASSINFNLEINLNSGIYGSASANGEKGFVIANKTTIENYKGGSSSDTVFGNNVQNNIQTNNGNDIIYGSSGNDTLNGGGGVDYLIYESLPYNQFNFSNYSVDNFGVTITNRTGGWIDKVENIEFFQFSDRTLKFSDILTGHSDGTVSAIERNHAPKAGDDHFIVEKGDRLVVQKSEILANDKDIDGDSISFVENNQVVDGRINTYRDYFAFQAPRSAGVHKFDYLISDGKGGTDVGTVTIDVLDYLNRPPEAVDDYFTMNAGSQIRIHVTKLPWNDTDLDGDPLSLVSVDNLPEGFTYASNYVTYKDEGTISRDLSFQYTVSDGVLTDTGNVFVTVNGTEPPPPVQPPPTTPPPQPPEPPQPESPTSTGILTFNEDNFSAYTIKGDRNVKVFDILDNGKTVHMEGNLWKKVALDIEITKDTVLEFDFKSNIEGENHSIGFDDNNYASRSDLISLHGTSNKHFLQAEPYKGDGNWQHYTIKLSEFFNAGKEVNYLTFGNDDDSYSNADSYFRNVEIKNGQTDNNPGNAFDVDTASISNSSGNIKFDQGDTLTATTDFAKTAACEMEDIQFDAAGESYHLTDIPQDSNDVSLVGVAHTMPDMPFDFNS